MMTTRALAAPRRRMIAVLLALITMLAANSMLSASAHADAASDLQWEQVQALASYNGALTAFEDPTVGSVIIFPSDYTGNIDNLQQPPNWTDSSGATPTSWPTPTTAKSAEFTADQIAALQAALYAAIQPGGDPTYTLSVQYDGMSDRVIAATNAPSSITDPLASQYTGQLVFDNSTPAPPAQSACPPAQGPTPDGTLSDPLTQLQELANYNCALAYFEDPNTGPVLIFPSDYAGDLNNLQTPTNWTDSTGAAPSSWPTPTESTSVQFTAEQIQQITDAVYNAITPNGSVTYSVSTSYDGPSDRIVVTTNAPSSVTDPLTAQYANQIVIKSTAPTCLPAQGPTPSGNISDPLTQLQELADYNCALGYFEDPNTGPVLIFPSDDPADINNLQIPSGWTDASGQSPTSWPTPTTSKSATFTAEQVQQITDAAFAQIDSSYSLSVSYDAPDDRMLLTTNAPSTVTDPLTSEFPNMITLATS